MQYKPIVVYMNWLTLLCYAVYVNFRVSLCVKNTFVPFVTNVFMHGAATMKT